MKLVIEDPKTAEQLNILFTNLCWLVEIVTIHKEEKGLHMQGMDFSRVCMFDIVLAPEWFTLYEEDDEDVEMISVSARIFNKVLSTYNKDQHIVIEILTKSDKVNMEFSGGKTSCDKYFELPLVYLEQELMNIPENKSQADIVITSKKLTDLVSQFEIFDQVLTFQMSEQKVLMKAAGTDGSMTAKLSLEDEQLIDYCIEEELELNVSFSLNYVKRITGFSKVSNDVTLGLSAERPMFIIYDLGNSSSLKLVLAPKIGEDD
ncbi:MAG: proliferating cell nuclear antigen (pcna) [Candidatus Pelagibacter sp.]|nr:proliferating cell nuclear antigen (pcna) [Candidatus Pelagibacter sp.]|tara:strand:+ start:3896 stop:4678 length:783 start_codon:yes stop_codon:yes gene_type:complete